MSNANGINRLARVIQQRARDVGRKPPEIDMATVQANGTLRLDTFEIDIPKEEYTKIEINEESETTKVIKYKAGDRVVIAFAGDDIVVLGRLV